MSLVVYSVCDTAGFDSEERCPFLVAAHNPRQAVNIWRRHAGDDDDISEREPEAVRAEWRWPNVPRPVPTEAGLFYPKTFRGFGHYDEGDPLCEGCDEHVDPEEFDRDADLCRPCIAAAALGSTP